MPFTVLAWSGALARSRSSASGEKNCKATSRSRQLNAAFARIPISMVSCDITAQYLAVRRSLPYMPREAGRLEPSLLIRMFQERGEALEAAGLRD